MDSSGEWELMICVWEIWILLTSIIAKVAGNA